MPLLDSEGRIIVQEYLRYLKILSFTLFRNSDIGPIWHSGRGNLKWLLSMFLQFSWFEGKTNVSVELRGQNSLCKSVNILKNPILHSVQYRSDLALGARETQNGYPIFDISHG